MKCSACGAKATGGRVTHHYVESGLSNVFLENVPIVRCSGCGEEELVIPRIEELHRLLAHHLASRPAPLRGEEFRFLRKYLGHASGDFAGIAGVTLETLSRWENGARAVDPLADRLIRMMVHTQSPIDEYPHDRIAELLGAIGPKSGVKRKAPRLSLVAPKGKNGGWQQALSAA